MEHRITAPVAGTIKQMRVSVGDQVDNGELLVVLEAAESWRKYSLIDDTVLSDDVHVDHFHLLPDRGQAIGAGQVGPGVVGAFQIVIENAPVEIDPPVFGSNCNDRAKSTSACWSSPLPCQTSARRA